MKKTATALLITLASGLAMSNFASAEPFNDRGSDLIAKVTSASASRNEIVVSTVRGFNDRGSNYIVESGSDSRTPAMDGPYLSSIGFNDRGHVN